MLLEMRARKERSTREEISQEVHILDHPFSHGLPTVFAIFSIGLCSGVMSGLFGVSGVVTLVVGFYLIKIKPKIIVGTSIFILFFKALSGFLWHLPTAEINWEIVLFLALGTSVGGMLGPKILTKFKHEKVESALEKIFIVIIIALGILFLVK